MRLRFTRGIHDFNRALAINPKLFQVSYGFPVCCQVEGDGILVLFLCGFQAFLSRAAYYGMKNRFSKGIMSCNEAIKLQPKSVRAYLYRQVFFHKATYSCNLLTRNEKTGSKGTGSKVTGSTVIESKTAGSKNIVLFIFFGTALKYHTNQSAITGSNATGSKIIVLFPFH